MMMKTCNYIELFAGVGGFHIGLDNANKDFFKCVLANQWEPSVKDQFAANIYKQRFPDDYLINDDICNVKGDDWVCDMMVFGNCCQDYSVVRSNTSSKGIEGKKGVLWWEIIRLITEMKVKPKYLLQENVDRMLISPSTQRGRDFALILKSLDDLGYDVEWRIINAAEYGFPQKRKRSFLFAWQRNLFDVKDLKEWVFKDGIFATSFPIKQDYEMSLINEYQLMVPEDWDLVEISDKFNKGNKKYKTHKAFENAGCLINGKIYTVKVTADYNGPYTNLGDILATGDDRNLITEDFYINEADIEKWSYVKGHKKIERVKKDGFRYIYNEGAMAFPDYLDRPARTLITSEGNTTPNRFTHVIKDPINGRYRRLIPLELERIQMFPDNHTEGTTDKKRAFLMGNALVTGIVTKIGEELYKRLKDETN